MMRCLRTTRSARSMPGGGEDRLLVLAALDQALGLEPLQHLAGRRARDAEHLGDPRGDRVRAGRRAVLADREGEEVDRLEVVVDRVPVPVRHAAESSRTLPSCGAGRRREAQSTGAETAIRTSAGTAAREYAPTWVRLQISVASVSKPIGRSSSVAGSSFIAERNTRRRASEHTRARERSRHACRASRAGPSRAPRAASSTRGLTRSSADSTPESDCGKKRTT